MFRLRRAVLVLVLALVAGACGSGSAAPSPQAGESTVSQQANGTAVASALTGTFSTIGSGEIDLASLQGHDVVLWFWAPW